MTSAKTMITDFTTGSITRKLIRFTIPFVISNLLQTLYSVVDMIIVGQLIGTEGLAAISTTTEFISVFTLVAMGLSTAGQILISQYIGSGDRASIKRTIGTMFTAILSISVVIGAIGYFARSACIGWMNVPQESVSGALDYTGVCFCGMFFIFGYNTVSAMLRGMGDSKRPLMFVAISAVTNLVLDYVFIKFFHWGTRGAGFATVIGQGLSFVLSIVYLYRRREAFGFDFKLRSFAIDKVKLILLSKVGFPMALQYGLISLSVIYINSYINSYGLMAASVTGVGSRIASITTVITGALSTADAAMVGQNLGAGRTDRVTKLIRISLWISIAFATVMTIVTLIFPTELFRIFDSELDGKLIMKYVPCAILNYYGFAMRAPFNGLLNGMGHVTMGLITCVTDGVVARIGASLLLGIVLNLGIVGFWYGSCFAGFVSVFIAGGYYMTGRWKTRKLLIDRGPK